MNNFDQKLKLYGVMLICLFLTLSVTLATLTIGYGEEYAEASEETRLKTLTVSGQRGQITDRNGVLLATNKKSFGIEFSRDVSKNTASDRALYTQSLLQAIEIIEENGGKVLDTSNLKRNDQGEFYFDFNTENDDRFRNREKAWRKNFYVGDTDDDGNYEDTPEDIYNKLRSRFQIPEHIDYETAFKLLSIWQEVQLNAYRSYYPIIIAGDVNLITTSELETKDFYLDCIQINEDYTRVYPKGTTAAHVLGYLGRESDQKAIDKNEELGYDPNDEIGVSGVEAVLEDELTGNTTDKKGQRLVEVNKMGQVIRELSSTPAKAGDNLVLTIDYELQKKAEEALAANIQEVRKVQEGLYQKDKAKIDAEVANRKDPTVQMADKGAAVVMDVNTGEVLAMASYPDYDPNIFVGGISSEDFAALNEDKSAPLYNKAISGGTPGSVFKMVTSVAGLMSGKVGLHETISDQGEFKRHLTDQSAKGPKCWTSNPSAHANQDVTRAIKNSCNYYFYEISYRMGIDEISYWSDQLGLTSKTNIELTGELTGSVGNQKVLYDNTQPSDKQQTGMAVLVKNQIIGYIKGYLEQRNIKHTDEEVTAAAEKLIQLVDGSTTAHGENIRKILHDSLDIPVAVSYANQWDTEINASLRQLSWNDNQTITTGIGQGITTVTPVAMARYVAALVNGGKVFDARLVKSVITSDGEVKDKQSTLFNTINVDSSYISAIKQGMYDVVNHNDGGGGVLNYFRDWTPERRSMIAGKTGTGQVSTVDIENNAWFMAFAPYEEPEIVVVVFLPNGYGGSYAAPTVKEIMDLYLDKREEKSKEILSPANTIQ